MNAIIGSALRRGMVSETTWVKIVIAGWLLLMAIPAFQKALPSSYWMTVTSIYVHDAVADTQPKMDVDRQINRPFTGKWIVEIERKTIRNTFYLTCMGQGEASYTSDRELPDQLDLEWWAGRKCLLPAGEYRVETTWIFPYGQVLRKFSNVFEIKTPTQIIAK